MLWIIESNCTVTHENVVAILRVLKQVKSFKITDKKRYNWFFSFKYLEFTFAMLFTTPGGWKQYKQRLKLMTEFWDLLMSDTHVHSSKL